MREKGGLGYTPDRVITAGQRSRLREQGYLDGKAGRPPANDHPEYRTSHRRGREAAARAKGE